MYNDVHKVTARNKRRRFEKKKVVYSEVPSPSTIHNLA
jgi:hypothetical protein